MLRDSTRWSRTATDTTTEVASHAWRTLLANELTALLDAGALDDVVRDHFVTGMPWYFRDNEALHASFCEHFVDGLGIALTDVCLVGSARTGFAVSPDAFPRPFHDSSDLDVAIVSPDLFDTAWLSLVTWGHPRRFTLPAGERQWMDDRQNDVFWGWLRPDQLRFKGLRFPRDLVPVRDMKSRWFGTFRSVGAKFPGTDLATREVSGRLYRSWDHLLRYQAEGLRRLRYDLSKRVNPEAVQ